MKNGNGKTKKVIKLRTGGTMDRTYHITGSGESYYAHNQKPLGKENGFTKSDFEGALRSASRKTSSAPAARKTGT